MEKLKWTIICIDEAHKIKNKYSRIYQELSKFKAPFKLLVTATPLINSVIDLWNLIAFGFGLDIDDYDLDPENLQIIGRLKIVSCMICVFLKDLNLTFGVRLRTDA